MRGYQRDLTNEGIEPDDCPPPVYLTYRVFDEHGEEVPDAPPLRTELTYTFEGCDTGRLWPDVAADFTVQPDGKLLCEGVEYGSLEDLGYGLYERGLFVEEEESGPVLRPQPLDDTDLPF